MCAVWRWAPTEGVRFQEGAAGRGAEGSLGTARCGEGSGGGGAVRLREERERREPPAGAGWSGAGGGAGLGAVLCAELREAEGKYGLGHKEDAVQPCLAARSAARCAGRGAKERPDGGGGRRGDGAAGPAERAVPAWVVGCLCMDTAVLSVLIGALPARARS